MQYEATLRKKMNDNAVSHGFINNVQCLAVNSTLKLQSTKRTIEHVFLLNRTQLAIRRIRAMDRWNTKKNRVISVVSLVKVRSLTFIRHSFECRLAVALRHLSTSARTQQWAAPAIRSSSWAKRSRKRAAERIRHRPTVVEKLGATSGLTGPRRRQTPASIRRRCHRWRRRRNRRPHQTRYRTSFDSNWTPLHSCKSKKRISYWQNSVKSSRDHTRHQRINAFRSFTRFYWRLINEYLIRLQKLATKGRAAEVSQQLGHVTKKFSTFSKLANSKSRQM